MPHLLNFVDDFAPVWRDPETGIKKPMPAAAWIAAGFEVAWVESGRSITMHPAPTSANRSGNGYWVVDLDSRRKAIEAPVPGREYVVDPRRAHGDPSDEAS